MKKNLREKLKTVKENNGEKNKTAKGIYNELNNISHSLRMIDMSINPDSDGVFIDDREKNRFRMLVEHASKKVEDMKDTIIKRTKK
jgi:hypothetical protein